LVSSTLIAHNKINTYNVKIEIKGFVKEGGKHRKAG
jgi:hypothetical protein